MRTDLAGAYPASLHRLPSLRPARPRANADRRRPLFTLLVLLTVFSTGFITKGGPFNFYWFYAALPPLLIVGLLTSGAILPPAALALFAAAATHAALAAALFGYPPGGALVQFIGLGTMFALFYMLIRANDFDVGYILSVYVRIAFWVSVLALIQAGSYAIGFRAGYDMAWLVPSYWIDLSGAGALRVRSVFSEPAVFGATIAPAILVAVGNLMQRQRAAVGRLRSATILAAALLTFSALTYAAIVLSLLLVALRNRAGFRPAWIGCGLLAMVAAYAYVPGIRLRVDDLAALYGAADPIGANLSSLTLHNNAMVAWEHLLATGFLGGGIGSHPLAFQRFSLLFGLSEIPAAQVYLNAEEASSLLLRILSETGLPGLILMLTILVRFHAPAATVRAPAGGAGAVTMPSNRDVSDAALVFLAVAFLRNGHYFAYGLPLFLLLYCYAHLGAQSPAPLPKVGSRRERRLQGKHLP